MPVQKKSAHALALGLQTSDDRIVKLLYHLLFEGSKLTLAVGSDFGQRVSLRFKSRIVVQVKKK